jgi:hypothetical protein
LINPGRGDALNDAAETLGGGDDFVDGITHFAKKNKSDEERAKIDGSCDDFLSVLSSYQNEDGGFGYNIEANNWNPNSSPYTICIALDYLDTTGNYVSNTKNEISKCIIKYITSGIYLTENGWVWMQGIPTNNDFAHMPWFHYDPLKPTEADIGVTNMALLVSGFAQGMPIPFAF